VLSSNLKASEIQIACLWGATSLTYQILLIRMANSMVLQAGKPGAVCTV